MLDEPLGNQPELSLAGLGLEPQAEVINLTEPVRNPPRRSLRRRTLPFPICLGMPDQPSQPGPRSLLDEAACLCALRTRFAPDGKHERAGH